jgi:hypothetical protein
MDQKTLLRSLLKSAEPSIRFKLRTGVLGENPSSAPIRNLQRAIKRSPRVKQLLSGRRTDGRISPIHEVYKKWSGAHWILAALADLGYPPADPSLRPAVDQVLDCWLDPENIREVVLENPRPTVKGRGVAIVRGRPRRCASQQGNALYAAVTLGFMDERAERLAGLLVRWQWPDGGWNCDRKPGACHSSFWETLTPLRGLAAYARAAGDARIRAAVERAAEVFLKRRLFRGERSGAVMNPKFLLLHYPCYWHYDILFGLKVMTEAGLLGDPRCAEALDLLQAKELPGGGWPAEERLYRTGADALTGRDLVDWGPTGKKRMNEWVTADALSVLRQAGRLSA